MGFRLVILLLIAALVWCPAGWAQDGSQDIDEGEVFRARVVDVAEVESVPSLEQQTDGFIKETQNVTVEILDGPFKGRVLSVVNTGTGHLAYDMVFKRGDEVLLQVQASGGEIVDAYIADYVRERHLVYLAVAFVVLLAALGGIKGAKSIVALGITGVAIATVLLPLLLKGHNPIAVTVLVAAAVTAVTFVIIGGWTKKSLAAVIGTTGGVVLAGVLALAVGHAAHLTGFSEEEAAMLMYIPQGVDFDIKGLLFAGIIIGALGAVMDVGMSIASAMDEIKKVNPAISLIRLVQAGMNVGRDIMGTMANTLILAYTGAAIPLMLVLMAYRTPLVKVINLDLIATEVVRALAGSIGLIIAIPITAVAAGLLLNREGGASGRKN
ncbi:YibE/F family protein [Desulforudis sp. 1088]|jgi:uncharacterized membrane protein|uniref:YibE/F family protein n=3 Tax=Candidatus Desulforudis TaxID=471826 RepID=UPI003486CD27